MKYSPSMKRYFIGDAEAHAPPDAFSMSEEQEDFVMAEKTAGNIIRYEGDQFVSYTPNAPPEDVLWRVVRQQRAELLAACDWTQMQDSPLSEEKRAELAKYRLALRDLPVNNLNPADPELPALAE